MHLLHLFGLGCMGVIAGAHTMECVAHPETEVFNWVAAIAYCVLVVVQVILYVLYLRKGNDPPPSL